MYKNTLPKLGIAIGLALGFLCAPLSATATTYEVTDLTPVFGSWLNIDLVALNNRGEIAGTLSQARTFDDPTGSAFGFIYTNGALHNITSGYSATFDGSVKRMNDNGDIVGSIRTGGPYANTILPFVYSSSTGQLTPFGALNQYNAGWGSAEGINNVGQIVGQSEDVGPDKPTSYYNMPFLYENGVATNLGTLGGPYWSTAQAINNQGQIAGHASVTGGSLTHAFIYENGTMQDIGTIGDREGNSYAWDINDAGHIVGQADSGAGSHAFLYRNGQMIDLDVFGTYLSAAGHINARDEVLGVYVTKDNAYIPFYYSDATGSIPVDQLLDPTTGWTLQSISDINDAGQMIGFARHNGERVPVLLTPVPEASTLAQGAVGILMVAGLRLHRRRVGRPASA